MTLAALKRAKGNEASQTAAPKPRHPIASNTASSESPDVAQLRSFLLKRSFKCSPYWYANEAEPTTTLMVLADVDAAFTTISTLREPALPGVLRIRLVAGAGYEAQDEAIADFTPTVADPVQDDEILTD